MLWIITAAIGLYGIIFLFFYSLCYAAKRGDMKNFHLQKTEQERLMIFTSVKQDSAIFPTPTKYLKALETL
jgi:hypothetical protein